MATDHAGTAVCHTPTGLITEGPMMNAPLTNDLALLSGSAETQQPFAWIGDLVGFLRRNLRLQSVCVGAATVLALAYVSTATPRYTAVATLLIDTRQNDLFRQHPVVSDAQIENAMIESEVETLRSPGLARRLVERLDLADDPAFTARPSLLMRVAGSLRGARSRAAEAPDVRKDRLTQQLLSMLNPHRIGLTYVIEIDATAASPVLAARLANGLIDAYLVGEVADRAGANRQASGWLEGRLAEARDKALKADQAVQAFKTRTGIVDTGHGTLVDQQIIELNSQLVAAQGRTAAARARLDRIRQSSGAAGAGAVSEALASPVINGLRERYLSDAQRVTEWSARFGPDHLAVVTLRKEMAVLQASIASEMRRIEKTAEGDLEVAVASQAALQAQLDAMVAGSATSNMDRATLRSLQSAADSYRTLYGAFLQRAVQSTQDESFPVADARVVTVARPPLAKSKPQGKLILLAAIVLGLGLGFALSFLREVLDRRLRTPAELEAQTGLECLAVLPLSPDTTAGAFVVSRPDDPFDRGFLQLQLRLQPSTTAGRGRLVGFVSLSQGAGTSTIAGSLVSSLVACGYSASIIDLSNEQHQTATSIRCQIAALQRDSDVVVVDLPPLSKPSQAHAMFLDITSLVLVVEAGRTDAAALAGALRAAGLDRRMLAGAVLNRVRVGT